MRMFPTAPSPSIPFPPAPSFGPATVTLSDDPGINTQEIAGPLAEHLNRRLPEFAPWRITRCPPVEGQPAARSGAEAPGGIGPTASAWISILSSEGGVILISPDAHLIASRVGGIFRAKLIAPLASRVAALCRGAKLDRAKAEELIRKRERETARHLRQQFPPPYSTPDCFDVIINLEVVSPADVAYAVAEIVGRRLRAKSGISRPTEGEKEAAAQSIIAP